MSKVIKKFFKISVFLVVIFGVSVIPVKPSKAAENIDTFPVVLNKEAISISTDARKIKKHYDSLDEEKLKVKLFRGSPDKPLVIFVHGWGSDSNTWTNPLELPLCERKDNGKLVEVLNSRGFMSPLAEPDTQSPLIKVKGFEILKAKPYSSRAANPLWNAIADEGYSSITWSQYQPNRTVEYSIAELYYIIAKVWPAHFPDKNKVIFIVHSRGGLVVRSYIQRNPAWAKDHVLGLFMISPANRGSNIGTFVNLISRMEFIAINPIGKATFGFYKKIFNATISDDELQEVAAILTGFTKKAAAFIKGEAIEELKPSSKFIRKLNSNEGLAIEKELGIPYFLFQGTMPYINDIYVRRANCDNAISVGKLYQKFIFKLSCLSELAEGKGDIAVSMENAKTGLEVFCRAYPYNHVAMLSEPAVRKDIIKQVNGLAKAARVVSK